MVVTNKPEVLIYMKAPKSMERKCNCSIYCRVGCGWPAVREGRIGDFPDPRRLNRVVLAGP